MAYERVDFNLDDDKTGSVISAAVSSMVLCMLFYILRICSRLVTRTALLDSDYLLFGGVLACYTISGIDLYVLRLGLGRHIQWVAIEDPNLDKIRTMLKFLMVNNCIYAFGQVTVKISLVLLYRHLFTSKTLHLIVKLTAWFMVAWGISFIGVAIFSCTPIHAFWEFQLQPTSYCINNQAWYIAMAVPTILTDIQILIMPIREVWKLQLDRKSKTALSFIFALGGFVCVISIIRVVALFEIDNADPSYTLVGIANWSSVEFAMAVICASLPTLRPLVKKMQPKSWSAADYSNSGVSGRDGVMNTFLRNRHKGQDDFERVHGVGTDSFAMHSVNAEEEPSLNAPDEHLPSRNQKIVVTNTFATTRDP